MSTYLKLPILLEAYNYSAVWHMLAQEQKTSLELTALVQFCMDHGNFDFEGSWKAFDKFKERLDPKTGEWLRANIIALEEGRAQEMFEELFWNILFQRAQEEYVDFVGRLYRFNEAFFKFVLAKEIHHHERMRGAAMQKEALLRLLKHKYHIYHGNILFATQEFFERHRKEQRHIIAAMNRLTSPKMKKLMELRHESVIGHGFESVTLEKIQNIYPSIDELMQELRSALETIGLSMNMEKYTRLNEVIVQWSKEDADDPS